MNTNQTSVIFPNMPVRYKLSGTYYYGRVKTITSNLLTIQGAPLTTGAGNLTELAFASSNMAVTMIFTASGSYGTMLSTQLMRDVMKFRTNWQLPTAYLVYFNAVHETNATTTQPKINIRLHGADDVSSNDSSLGIQLSTSLVENPDIAINTAKYNIGPGDSVDVNLTAVDAGATNAANLTVTLYFVLSA